MRIRQIEGAALRDLRLSRGALPVVGDASWGGVEQRAAVNRPPHARRAEVLLLGPEYTDASFAFRWRARLLDGTGAITLDGEIIGVREGYDALEAIATESALVAVELDGRERVGILSVGELQPLEAEEYAVDVSVVWVATVPDLDEQARAAPDARAMHRRLIEQWEASLGAAAEPAVASSLTVDSIEASIGQVTESIRAIGRSVSDPIRRGTTTGLRALQSAASVLDAAASVPVSVLCATDDPAMKAAGRRYLTDVGRGARRLRDAAVLERPTYDAMGRPDVLGVHEAVEGETIWTVARIWYGALVGIEGLRAANTLTGPRLRAGQRVIVPRLRRA